MKLGITIPVGPLPHHTRWIEECLTSVKRQTHGFDHLVLVDDMNGITADLIGTIAPAASVEIWRSPWRLGVPHAFNIGVARAFAAGCDLVLMHGADDTLSEDVGRALDNALRSHKGADGFYWLDVHYDDGEEQRLPCNAAAVTPGFWRTTGGFPPEAAIGGCDGALVSAMLVHWPESLIHVGGAHVNVRRHPDQETARQGGLAASRDAVRNWYTETYRPAQWGRSR